jgi:hypothetical protein
MNIRRMHAMVNPCDALTNLETGHKHAAYTAPNLLFGAQGILRKPGGTPRYHRRGTTMKPVEPLTS